jgi:NTP pyrophosphatase (non-canonical NTP hydrolase)
MNNEDNIMEKFSLDKMQNIQKELQEKYKDKWEPISSEAGKNKLLWLMIELGEVADIIKKDGNKKIIEDADVRKHFIEELCDVLMYYNDVMLCYNISVEELKEIYLEKHKKNMGRW